MYFEQNTHFDIFLQCALYLEQTQRTLFFFIVPYECASTLLKVSTSMKQNFYHVPLVLFNIGNKEVL